MRRGQHCYFVAQGKAAAGRDWGLVPGDLVRYQTETMSGEQTGRVLAVAPLALQVDDHGWLRTVPATAYVRKQSDAPAGWQPPAWYVARQAALDAAAAHVNSRNEAATAAPERERPTEDTIIMDTRICPICKLPLPEDTHPNRKYHLGDCTAAAIKLHPHAKQAAARSGQTHPCRGCKTGITGQAKLCQACREKRDSAGKDLAAAAADGHTCLDCEARLHGRARLCEPCAGKRKAAKAAAKKVRPAAADPNGDREYADLMRHVRKPAAAAVTPVPGGIQIEIRVVVPASELARLALANGGR